MVSLVRSSGFFLLDCGSSLADMRHV